MAKSAFRTTVRTTAAVIVLAAYLVQLAEAGTVKEPLYHLFHARQVATSGSNTNISGASNGGSQSAQQAASAAGSSIDTGAGGSRSTPDSPEAFARLLSGTFFGAILTIMLGGALFVQIWHYFERFGGRGADRILLQCKIAAILVFSIIQSCVLIHRIWDIHVANFGNFAFPLLTVGWEIAMSFVCIGVMSSLVQSYYVHRLWFAFNKNRIILIVYTPLLLFTFAGGIASAVLILQAGSAANVKGEALYAFQLKSIPWKFSVVFATWLCSTATIEISICVSLIWQLTKVSTPFFHTRHAVARLSILSLETSIATTTLSLVSMILFLAIPYQFYYNITFLPIGQVSASSLLVTLMARPSIARELAQDQMMPLEGGLEAAMSRAPNSLAKPVVKRMMRKEWKKRPQGDGTGVNLTVTVHEEASNGYVYGEKAPQDSSSSNEGSADLPSGYDRHKRANKAHEEWQQSMQAHSHEQVPTEAISTQNNPNVTFATNFMDAIVTGRENTGIGMIAAQHSKAQNKQAGLTASGPANSATFGVTPRGRVVGNPPSGEDSPTHTRQLYADDANHAAADHRDYI